MIKEILKLYESEFMLYQALKLTQDVEKAEDLVQDTLIRIMERQDRYKQKGSLEGFVTVVMKRIYLNKIRHLKITSRIMDVYAQKYKPSESDMTDYVFCRQLIKESKHKDILKHVALGYTTKDIAKILGINMNTAFSRTRYMRESLAQFKD
jgi:RNA polymerase sigma factor (sigma-70 family)